MKDDNFFNLIQFKTLIILSCVRQDQRWEIKKIIREGVNMEKPTEVRQDKRQTWCDYDNNFIFFSKVDTFRFIYKRISYPHRFQVFFFQLCWSSTEFQINPFKEIINSFRCWNDVEGRRNCPPVFKVRNPQLTTGKFPLSVRPFLNVKTGTDQLRK